MDQDFNAIGSGADFSQLTETEKTNLLECLKRLMPFGWTTGVLKTWYVNRKVCVVHDGDVTRYYGLMPTKQWRELLEDAGGKLTWKVRAFQWLPATDEGVHR